MPTSLGALLAVAALGSLSAANMAPRDAMVVAICGSTGTVTIPLDGSAPGPRRDCAVGCHAICGRKSLAGAEED